MAIRRICFLANIVLETVYEIVFFRYKNFSCSTMSVDVYGQSYLAIEEVDEITLAYLMHRNDIR